MENIKNECRMVAIWLFAIAAMVMIMAVIGAITRLTESGLSIVEWRPISGALPPMSSGDWLHLFESYKMSPQYMLVNQGMTLPEFKNIFWWEWVHREWGRMIGLIFAVGALWFWARGTIKRIGNDLGKNLIAILILGLAQGAMGWFMVASGLVRDPAVSHYRLAAHLVLAAALYIWSLGLGLYIWQLQSSTVPVPFLKSPRALYRHSLAALGLVLITLIWGAFTAGLRAGLVYNTWPLMNGHLAPPDFWFLRPLWLNFFENSSAVQFTHRCLAYLASLMCISIGLMTYIRKIPAPVRRWGYAVGIMGFLQPALGIVTVLTHVDLHPAVTHQAGAFILIGLLVLFCMQLSRAQNSS